MSVRFRDPIPMKRLLINIKALMVAMVVFSSFLLRANTGLAQEAIPDQAIDRWIQSRMEQNNIPGLSIAITRGDQIVYAKGYGIGADRNPVTADTPFAIASLSKSFTALAVMQLAEAGLLDLDAPVVRYMPSFQSNDIRSRTITARHLLHHTSGLTEKAYPDMTVKPQPHTLDEVVKRLQTVKLQDAPGQMYRYNNTNYELLAKLVETVSGQPFGEYVQRHILQPVQMTSTSSVSNTNQFGALADRLPKGHYLLFGQAVAAAEPEWFVEGAAGMISTANDMAKWLLLQANEGTERYAGLLSKGGFEAMHAPASAANSYGMGWNVLQKEGGEKQIYHSGILWTYKSEALLIPERRLGIVVLFNSGLNAFVDYYSFVNGLADWMDNRQPAASFLSNTGLEIGIGTIILITAGIGLRKITRLNQWEKKYNRQTKWLTVLRLLVTLLPVYILLALQPLISWIGGGRVLSLDGIYMMMPSVVIWLAIAAVLSIAVVFMRVLRLARRT